jgi:hypothetical protein
MILAFVAVLYSAAALAQTSTPPATEDQPPPAAAKPAKQAKEKETKAKPAAKGAIAVRLQACQDIDDGTKGRLDCYDAVIPPAKPPAKPKAGAAKTVMECKFTKEEDERLACYNGFVDSMPKLPKS